MFTPEKLKEMSNQAQKEIINEEIRAGKRVPYYGGPGPEEFEKLSEEPIKRATSRILKSKPKLSPETNKGGQVSRYVEAERRLEDLNDRGPRRPGSKLII